VPKGARLFFCVSAFYLYSILFVLYSVFFPLKKKENKKGGISSTFFAPNLP
jgi:hypothetical protein